MIGAAPAAAHVTVVPPFIAAGDTATLNFTAPNERDTDMTGFALTVPSEFRIVDAVSTDNWRGSVNRQTVTWTDGRLGSGSDAAFGLEVEAPREPGPAHFEAEQLYTGGAVVRWAVALTVTPAVETPSQNLGWAVVTALVGAVVLTGIGVAILLRKRSLQEK
ncbi:MAG: hypothetical protein ACRDOF_07265 [Gaiellaceae bacterium]